MEKSKVSNKKEKKTTATKYTAPKGAIEVTIVATGFGEKNKMIEGKEYTVGCETAEILINRKFAKAK
jgi:hypothetical protein